MQPVEIRYATLDDLEAIRALYHAVTLQGSGIARKTAEVTDQYIRSFIRKSLEQGNHPGSPAIESVESWWRKCTRPAWTPKVFNHVLSDLTIVVHPAFQEYGIGPEYLPGIAERGGGPSSGYPAGGNWWPRKVMKGGLKFYEMLGFIKEAGLREGSPAMVGALKRIFLWLGSIRGLRRHRGTEATRQGGKTGSSQVLI